jgi:hypothetical protein
MSLVIFCGFLVPEVSGIYGGAQKVIDGYERFFLGRLKLGATERFWWPGRLFLPILSGDACL